MEAKPIKVVFCGGETAGKSCLLAAMKNGEWMDSYLLPRDTENEELELELDGNKVKVSLNDLGKIDDYKENCEEVFLDAGVFIVCFDLC